jgi:hypothetical protein
MRSEKVNNQVKNKGEMDSSGNQKERSIRGFDDTKKGKSVKTSL